MINITYASKTFSKGTMGQKLFNGFSGGRRVHGNFCMCPVESDLHKPHSLGF